MLKATTFHEIISFSYDPQPNKERLSLTAILNFTSFLSPILRRKGTTL